MTSLQIYFSAQQVMPNLNGFFMETDVNGMLERKDFSALDMLFQFIGAFLDCAAGYESQPGQTKLNTIYSIIINELLFGHHK